MFKYLILGTLLCFATAVTAQVKRDTAIYPMIFEDGLPFGSTNGTWVDDVKKANGFRLVISPDTVLSGLYIVNDCYLNGDMRMRGKSLTDKVDGQLTGTCISYFANGFPKAVFNLNNQGLEGDATAYYPNGSLYYSGKFISNDKFEMYESRDSLGRKMVESGNGKFVRYDATFKNIIEDGSYENAVRTGNWKYLNDDTTISGSEYQAGVLVSGGRYNDQGKLILFEVPQVFAKYKMGMDDLYKFIYTRTHYSERAKKEEIKGYLQASFVVEPDGEITGVKISKGLGYGFDEQIVALLKQTTKKWEPATRNGIAVRSNMSLMFRFGIEYINLPSLPSAPGDRRDQTQFPVGN